jgi:NADP-dependent 3-hydroxy acid dehydrogenase YdfG
MAKPLVAVTGASSGIGAAAAAAFSAVGHPLLVTARRLDKLTELGLPDALCRQHDVRDAEAYVRLVREAEERHGPVDLLVNNAGTMVLDQFANHSADEWQRQFDVNCVGLLNTTAAVLPGMLERRTGTIMNVGSTAGRNIYDNHTVYSGTKHAVHALTEGLRREAAPAGVRVILVSPGFVSTELIDGTDSAVIREAYDTYREDIGGPLAPEDIARLMVFAYQQPQELCMWEIAVAPTRQVT